MDSKGVSEPIRVTSGFAEASEGAPSLDVIAHDFWIVGTTPECRVLLPAITFPPAKELVRYCD
jgi:hypothetical protein